MAVSQPGYFNLQEFTALGALAAGYRLYTYTQGTTTKKTAYTDAAGSVAHTYTSDGAGGEYIALDARGELPAPLYLTAGAYDITLKTNAGATVWTRRADPQSADLSAFVPAGTGAVTTTVQAKLRERVSLVDFGAVGDGATDDTAAINLAIAALPTYGGTIEVGYGSFLHDSAITVNKKVRFVGQGTAITNGQSASEFLKGSGISGDGFILATAGCTVEGIAFRGQGGNGGDGVVFKAGRITMRDCAVYAMGNDGIRIGTDAGGENCNLWNLTGVKSKSNGRDGVRVSEGAGALADANAGTMMHCDLQSNTGAGLYLGGTQLNTIVGGAFQSNGTYGIHFGANASYHTVWGGDVESNTTSQIRLETGCTGNAIHNFTLLLTNFSIGDTSAANRIECGDHNRVISGVKFPPTQVASTDVNTLDDYKETDFSSTVSVEGTSAAGTPTWTTRIATATKVGNIVHVNLALTWSAHTGTGNIRITGLPHTSNATLGRASFPVSSDNLTYGSGSLIGFLQSNTTYIDLYLQATGAASSAVAMDTAATVYANFSYRV